MAIHGAGMDVLRVAGNAWTALAARPLAASLMTV